MEALSSPPMPDGYFWYVISTAFLSALIWIINRYVNRIDRLFEKLTTNIEELMRIAGLHEHRINEAEQDIDDLKKRI